ncbi:sugar O-acetyltransferase [Bacteroides sp. 519]|uniref:sugar O-acetyltransferase n=1 Tax=Bacteroides sp. 519 TaxID=2302937 RepID=UPI0013D44E1D|nr:sugar O-acetyltransferase [Bacteroides sp. 519]NDV60778.1 sugar O-acetyltransferase [Bacteroides sp. 519]
MTEKEKAYAGLLYDFAGDPELQEAYSNAKNKCFEFNNIPPYQKEERDAFIKQFLGKTGNVINIISPFHCDYGYNIEVGENFFANMNLVVLDAAKVKIGDNVFIAPNVGIYTAGHPFDIEQRNQGLEYAYPVTIGNNVWIGAQVAILPGVTIGDNTVIGAGSVVTKDIPAGVLAVGNPCKVIRQIAE